MVKKEISKILIFVLILAMSVAFLSAFFNVQSVDDTLRAKGFEFEKKNSLDVVFIGASDVYSGISNTTAWEEYGFTNYSYAISGMPISLVKPAIKEVLHKQSPKVIVVEINGAGYKDDSRQMENVDLQRIRVIDNMSFTKDKIDTINELVPEDQRMSYYFPLVKYHSNWQHPGTSVHTFISTIDFYKRGYSVLKGYRTETMRSIPKGKIHDVANDYNTRPLSKMSDYYLRDLLQYCKDENINNILFIRGIHRMAIKQYGAFRRINSAGNLITEYGFKFVNFDRMHQEIGIKDNEDFYNNDHLNVFGAEKFTKYLGKYLVDNYDLKDCKHSQKTIDEWNYCAKQSDRVIEMAKANTLAGKRKIYTEFTLKFSKNSVKETSDADPKNRYNFDVKRNYTTKQDTAAQQESTTNAPSITQPTGNNVTSPVTTAAANSSSAFTTQPYTTNKQVTTKSVTKANKTKTASVKKTVKTTKKSTTKKSTAKKNINKTTAKSKK